MSGRVERQLAELDEGRPELVEHLAQVLAARRPGRPFAAAQARLRGPARQQVGELVRLEEVPEAVLHHDLGDLRQAAEIARRRLRHLTECTAEALRASDRGDVVLRRARGGRAATLLTDVG